MNHKKKVAILIAPSDFRDEEYFQPKVMLDAVGLEISTVAKGNPEEVTGVKGGKAHTDAKLEDINPRDYEGIVVIGGSGAHEYFDDKQVHDLLKSFAISGKVLAAICIAPVILAKAGVLTRKEATVFKDGIDQLLANDVAYVDKSIVKDGNIITACDHTVAMKFGEEIAKMIKSNN